MRPHQLRPAQPLRRASRIRRRHGDGMQPYAGFEPQVGEIRALRCFRVGPGGVLYPLFHNVPWADGTNTAQCPIARPAAGRRTHLVPEPACSCGYYAYGSAAAAGQYPQAQSVLAVVACWGRVIAGTRGLRAEHCRIEALWLAPRIVPADLAAAVARRYPSVKIFQVKAAMLDAFAPTRLDCYEERELRRPKAVSWARVALGVVLVLSTLPSAWWGGLPDAQLAWSAVVGLVGLALLFVPRTPSEPDVRRRRIHAGALMVWAVAPLGGVIALFWLRAPLALLVVMVRLQRLELWRASRRFPAEIG